MNLQHLLAVLAGTVLAGTLHAAPAQAREATEWANFANTGRQVCVRDHTGRAGDLAAAVRRWDAAGADLYVSESCTWDNAWHIIDVRPYTERGTRKVGDYATARWYPETGKAALGVVRLNRYQPTGRRACVRRWAMAHELGHALGLAHRGGDSVMNAHRWRACGQVTATDRRDLARIR